MFRFFCILSNTPTIDFLMGGISTPNWRHVSTSLLESSSLFERPAARIFACSYSVKICR